MNVDDLTALYRTNPTLTTSLAALAVVGVLLLLITHRMRKIASHRATLLVANLLTVIAAALATMVSASGMWKFFTDILGPSPLRYAFFWFIEVALFASALLARARLLRDPHNASTGVDGIAVWVFAALTASLSALDSDSLREVCLRLAAPLVAAWMWERALAAERHARLGSTGRIHWTVSVERIFVWLRLAEAHGRDVTDIDRARRRARLGQARLHLHLLQGKRKTSGRRLRRAHNKVIRRAMQAAEHIGLAESPDAANERQAIQMYMATLYGIVAATTPEAVAHLNAWQTTRQTPVPAEENGMQHNGSDPGRTAALAVPALALPHRVDAPPAPAEALPELDLNEPDGLQAVGDHDPRQIPARSQLGRPHRPADEPTDVRHGTEHQPDAADDDANRSAAAAMRRFWDAEIAQGRIPTGAALSRAAGVPPTTGLGRRRRREWEAELSDHLRRTVAGASR